MSLRNKISKMKRLLVAAVLATLYGGGASFPGVARAADIGDEQTKTVADVTEDTVVQSGGTLHLQNGSPLAHLVCKVTTTGTGVLLIDGSYGAVIVGNGSTPGVIGIGGTGTSVNSAGLTLAVGTLSIESGATLSNTAGLTFSAGDAHTNLGTLNFAGGGFISISNGAKLTNSGTLTIDGTGANANAGTLAVSGTGVLDIKSGATLTNTGTLTIDGTGANANAGTLTVSGAGKLDIKSGAKLTNVGALNIQSGATGELILNGNGTLTNEGTMNVDGGTLSVAGALYSSPFSGSPAKIIFGGGTLTVASTGSVFVSGELALTSGTAHTNAGTIQMNGGNFRVESGAKLASTGNLSFLAAGVSYLNAGTLEINGGTMRIDSPAQLTSTGKLDIIAGTTHSNSGTLELSGATSAMTIAAGAKLTNTGTLDIKGGTHSNAGTLLFNGSGTPALKVTSGAKLSNSGVFTLDTGTTHNNAGTIEISGGTFTLNAGTLTTSGGTMNFAGGTEHKNAGSLIFTGSGSTLSVASGVKLVNNGTLQLDNGIYTNAGTISFETGSSPILNVATPAATLNNDNGVLDIVKGTGHANSGTINFIGDSSALKIASLSFLTVQTSGKLNINAGTLHENKGKLVVLSGGTLTVGNGAKLDNVSGGDAGDIFDNTGTVNITGGTLAFSAGTGHSVKSGGKVTFDGTAPKLSISSGAKLTLESGANMTLKKGTAHVNSGLLNILGVTTGDTLVIDSGAMLDNNGTGTGDAFDNTASGRVSVNSGTLSFSAGTAHSNAGTMTFSGESAKLDIASGAILTVTDSGAAGIITINGGTGHNVAGTMVLNGTAFDIRNGVVLTIADTGKVDSSTSWTFNSGAKVVNNGKFKTTATMFEIKTGAQFENKGDFEASGGVTNNGTMTFTGALAKLIIADSKTFANAGTLTLLGGTEHSFAGNMNNSGTLTLGNGTDAVEIINNGTFTNSGKFTVNSGVTFTNETGKVNLSGQNNINNGIMSFTETGSQLSLAASSKFVMDNAASRLNLIKGTTHDNEGVLTINNGTLAIMADAKFTSGSSESGAKINLNAGTHSNAGELAIVKGELTVAAGAELDNSGVFSNAADGKVSVSGALAVTTAGSGNNKGEMLFSGDSAKFTLADGAVFTNSKNITVKGGTLHSIAGTFTNGHEDAKFTLDTGGTVKLSVTDSGTLDLSNGIFAMAKGSTLDNAGTVTVSGTAQFTTNTTARINNSGSITVSGGTFDLAKGATLENTGVLDIQANVTNAGTMNFTGDSSKLTVGASLTNDGGVITISGGTEHKITSGLTNKKGSFTVNSGVTIENSGSITNISGGTFSVAAGATITTTGTVELGGKFNYNDGTLLFSTDTGTGNLIVDGGAIFTSGSSSTSAFINLEEGTAHRNSGTFNLDGGTLAIGSGAKLTSDAGSITVKDGATVNSEGILAVTGGTLNNNGTMEFSGSEAALQISNGAKFTNGSGAATATLKLTEGTHTNDGTFTITAGTLSIGNDASFTSGSSAAATAVAVTINGGTVVNDGTMKILKSNTTAADATSKLTVASGATLLNNNEITFGTGVETTVKGTFNIGGGTAANAGTLTFSGDTSAKLVIGDGAEMSNIGTMIFSNGTAHTIEGTLTSQGTDGNMELKKGVTVNVGGTGGKLTVAGGTFTVNSGATINVSDSGTMEINGGTNNIRADGTVVFTSASSTLSIGAGAELDSAGILNLQAGEHDNSGTLTVSGGTFTINTGASLVTTSSGTLNLEGGITLNKGTLTLESGSKFLMSEEATLDNIGTFNTERNFSDADALVGTLKFSGTDSVFRVESGINFTCGSASSSGNIKLEQGTGHINLGTLQIDKGTLTVSEKAAMETSGTFTLSNGGGYGTGGGVLDSKGKFTVSDGQANIMGTATFSGNSASLTIKDSATFCVGSSTASGASLSLSGGTHSNAGTFTMDGGTVSMGKNVQFTNASGGSVTITSGTFSTSDGVRFENSSGASFTMTTASTGYGSGATFTLAKGAVFNNAFGAEMILTAGAFNNEGTLELNTGSTVTITGGSLASKGIVNISTDVENAGTMSFTGNSSKLSISSGSTVNSSGTITISGGAGHINNGTLNLTSSSSIYGGGTSGLTLSGATFTNKGAMTVESNLKLETGGVMVMNDSAQLNITSNGKVDSVGRIVLDKGTHTNEGTFTLNSGAVMTVAEGVVLENKGEGSNVAFSVSSGAMVTVNGGTMKFTAGTDHYSIGTLEYIGANAVFNVGQNTQFTSGATVSSGNINTSSSAGAVLKLTGGTLHANNGTMNVAGGAFTLSTAKLTNTKDLNIFGADVTIDANSVIATNGGKFVVNSGSATSDASIANKGTMSFEGADVEFSLGENATLTNNGKFTLAAGDTHTNTGTIVLVTGGTMTVSGADTKLTTSGKGTLQIDGGTHTNEGTLAFTNDSAQKNVGLLLNAGTLNNTGTLEINGGTAHVNKSVINFSGDSAKLAIGDGAQLTTSGVLNLTAGTEHTNNGTLTFTGTVAKFSVASGATLISDGDNASLDIREGKMHSIAGKVEVAGGAFATGTNAVVDVTGELKFTGGDDLTNNGTLNFNKSTLSVSGIELVNDGTINFAGEASKLDIAADGTLSGDGGVRFSAGTSHTNAGHLSLGNGSEIAKSAVLTNSGGSAKLTFTGDFTNAGTLAFVSCSDGLDVKTYTLDNTGKVILTGSDLSNTGGTLKFSDNASQLTIDASSSFTFKDGTSATGVTSGKLDLTAGTTHTNEGTLAFEDSATLNIAKTGGLVNKGMLKIGSAANITNSGVLSFDGSGAALNSDKGTIVSKGTLNVTNGANITNGVDATIKFAPELGIEEKTDSANNIVSSEIIAGKNTKFSVDSASTFNNEGTLELGVGASHVNKGKVNVTGETGKMILGSQVTLKTTVYQLDENGKRVQVGAPTSSVVNGDATYTNEGTTTFAGAKSELVVNPSATYINSGEGVTNLNAGTHTNSGTVRLTDGRINVGSDASFTNASGGTLKLVSGTFANAGTMNLEIGSTLDMNSAVVLENTGSININTAACKITGNITGGEKGIIYVGDGVNKTNVEYTGKSIDNLVVIRKDSLFDPDASVFKKDVTVDNGGTLELTGGTLNVNVTGGGTTKITKALTVGGSTGGMLGTKFVETDTPITVTKNGVLDLSGTTVTVSTDAFEGTTVDKTKALIKGVSTAGQIKVDTGTIIELKGDVVPDTYYVLLDNSAVKITGWNEKNLIKWDEGDYEDINYDEKVISKDGALSLYISSVVPAVTDAEKNLPGLGAVQQGTITVLNTAHDAVVNRLSQKVRPSFETDEDSETRLANDRYDKDVWASFVHAKDEVKGMQLDNMTANHEATYKGGVVGVDLHTTRKAVTGIAVSYVDGDIAGSGDYVGIKKNGDKYNYNETTRNEAEYVGGSIYNRSTSGNTSIITSVGYIHSKNELDQLVNRYDAVTKNVTSTVNTVADAKVDAFTADFRVEQAMNFMGGQLIPMGGVRYMRLQNKEFKTNRSGEFGTEHQDLVMPQIGISWSANLGTRDSWLFRPVAEAGYIWTLGEKDVDCAINYRGTDVFTKYDTAEGRRFYSRLGVEIVRANLTLSCFYNRKKGDVVDTEEWLASMLLDF